MTHSLTALFVFLFGLCIGSFLNVCIHRLPLNLSIVRPRSRCPNCGTPVSGCDNVPVFSYLALGGRCRSCKAPIGIRYPLVELLTGFLAMALFARFGITPACAVFFLFTAVLIVVTFIDLDHRIIPDRISLPGIPLFFFLSLLVPGVSFWDALLGILSGGGSLYLVAWGYHAATGQEGMGGGDIKLLAMIGALIGWQGVLFTIFAGSVLGCTVGLALMMHTRKTMKLAIPFGPFLSAGALLYVFFGPHLVHWYFNLLR